MKKKIRIILFFISLILSGLLALPELRLPRSFPGNYCHNLAHIISEGIKCHNEFVIMDHNKPELQIKTFTESPKIASILKDAKYFRIDVQSEKRTPECNYGTVGDLTKNGHIVCLVHGVFEKDIDLKDKKGAFYSKEKGEFYRKDLLSYEDFSSAHLWLYKRNFLFRMAKGFFIIFSIIVFISELIFRKLQIS